MTNRICLFVICTTVVALPAGPALAAGEAEAESVRNGYRRPTVVVPYARTKPTIDGKINEAEWRGAVSVNALQTTRKQISLRQTRFWQMWDEENIYVAMRSPLRPGERIVQALRRRKRDINVVFDDSYEVWLDVGSADPKTGLVCFYQFLCNYAGARWDSMHLPSVGNSRLGYESGWTPANRISPDNAWEMELVIPRKSIGKKDPFKAGFAYTCLIARNFKRPWEQNSFAGVSSFAALDSHAQYVMSKTAPAVHLLSVADAKSETFGLTLAAVGQTDGKLKWRFASDGGVVKEGVLSVRKGKLARVPAMAGLDKPGDGSFRITVTSADGKTTLLDWCAYRQFGARKDFPAKIADRGDVVVLTPQFNPVHNYVRITGDFINYDARGKIRTVRVAVKNAAGKQLGKADLTIDKKAYVDGIIRLGDIPYGKYTAELVCLDSGGGTILSRTTEFTKKDHAKSFEWWNTKRGNIEKVISPWTPVTYAKDTFGVWGRKMQRGLAGPRSITTQGRELLAGPIRLIAELPDGKTAEPAPLRAKSQTTFRKAHRVTVAGGGRLGEIVLGSTTMVEFDGMYKVTMTLTPPRGGAKVKSLKLVIPLKPDAAEYVHAVGEGIRTGYYYGFLPKAKRGRIWDCRTVDSQPTVVGSFIPYVWVGSPAGGLAWFADSDEGWAPSDKTPAIEIRRDGDKSVDLVLNLISEPTTIDKPRTITFAFQASPVKKMHRQWRMDSWWCGDTFYDFAGSGSTIWLAIPYCRDIPKCRKMVEARHKGANSYIFGVSKYRANAVPYFIHQTLPRGLVPEIRYFGDQWRTSISDCLYYGKTLTDYMVHNYSKWCEQTGIDGYYVDNMRPVACDNIDAGRGYRLPDGRIQPTYQMFSTRRYFLRMRAAFAEQGKHNKIVLHMTNCMIIPWVGAADIAYDGEHHVIYPEMGKDFMDFWSLERMRVDFSGQWGTAVNFMHEYQGRWKPADLWKAMRAYSGLVILHDALASGNSNGLNTPLWIGRDRFGIEADDVRFLPYWDKDAGLSCKTKGVLLAGWLRPGKLLLAVVNRGEKAAARVVLDAKKLGLPDPSRWKVTDAEAGCKRTGWVGKGAARKRVVLWDAAAQGAIRHDGRGTLTVPVERHDYRQVIIERK